MRSFPEVPARGCPMLECVANISEGRDHVILGRLAAAAGPCLLDIHADADHHRSVFTLAGRGPEVEAGVRALSEAALAEIDLTRHRGAHPRFGVIDVVPWIHLEGRPLTDGQPDPARQARDRFARWAGSELQLPCFLYGPERTLPDVRRQAWHTLTPDTGPGRPDLRGGAVAVGMRPLLVAYNLWLRQPDLGLARRIAAGLRSPQLRTLAISVGRHVQVSCNLVAPAQVGPVSVYDAVAAQAEVARAELVGLIPANVLAVQPRARWAELDLDESRTIESRLDKATGPAKWTEGRSFGP